eukprot:6148-Prorocentrum_minimum.AAC.5
MSVELEGHPSPFPEAPGEVHVIGPGTVVLHFRHPCNNQGQLVRTNGVQVLDATSMFGTFGPCTSGVADEAWALDDEAACETLVAEAAAADGPLTTEQVVRKYLATPGACGSFVLMKRLGGVVLLLSKSTCRKTCYERVACHTLGSAHW